MHARGGDGKLRFMLRWGRFEICSVVNGTFRLDGGAMFGVVPRTLWQSTTDADEENRILLGARSLLAVDRATGRVIVVDTGCGTKWSPKQAERFAIQHDPSAIELALKALGMTRTDVTDVVVTHLHFDHNGGLTDWYDDPDGPTVLCFPKARHWIHRRHWDHAQAPNPKDRASFIAADFAALPDADVLHFIEGDGPAPTIDGVAWFVSHGHTPYHLHPVFEGDMADLLFVGDLVPTVAHLRLPWVMAYDLQPVQTIREREEIYGHCLRGEMALAFAHDPKIGGVTLSGTTERPIVTEVLPL